MDDRAVSTFPVMPHALPDPIIPGQPLTALAPMQDVTDLPFMKAISRYGAPDYFFTEFFRVHSASTLERHIVDSILEHGTGRPVFAQIIGENLYDIRRTIRELIKLPIAGVDLNMGCPAPKVYKKNVGGGLLREPEKVAEIFAAMRDECPGRFTVKMRIGFEDDRNFERILDLVNEHRVDLLSLHARTVREMYRGEPHYRYIRRARERVECPVLANGNISSSAKGAKVIEETGAAGLMIGRSAIRNPWIFRQCREHFAGREIFTPRLSDVRDYVDTLWESTSRPGLPEVHQVSRMKKFLNFVGQGVDEGGVFLKAMRRTQLKAELMELCDEHMIRNGNTEKPFANEPHADLIARPNAEGPLLGSELRPCSL